MAEFALGLTKTAVEGTLIRVKSAIEEEAQLKVRVQNDLVFITGEFEMMQSFLKIVNTERTKNEVVRTWVGQLRDLAYDVEDCVDFVVHLDKTSDWTSWVRRLVSSCICMALPLPLDVAVAEIKQLKARVMDVSERNNRYSLISDSGSSSSSAITLVSSPTAAAPGATASAGAAAAFNILSKVWEDAGKKRRGTGDLRTLITSEGSDLQVISLYVGSGGGAAAAAAAPHVIREAYNDPKIRQEFSIRAWVKLMHPFNPEEFMNMLLTQFDATSTYHPNGARSKLPHIKGRLMERVNQQRYLVILEDVSTVVEWDVIKVYLPDRNNGSRVVVSVNQLGLALSCTGEPYQVSEIRHFARGQSLCSFIRKVPGCRSDMSEFINKLSCGGVISVWRVGTKKSNLLDSVYTSITHKLNVFKADGVEFEKHCWVDVPSPFNFDVFSQRLLLSFYSDDYGAKEIAEVGMMGGVAIQYCRGFLREHNCLVILNGIEEANHWDMIKSNFLSEHTKGCILVMTKKHCCVHHAESLAKHCVDEKDQAINIEDLEADAVLHHLIKSCRHYGIGGKEASNRGRLFSNRMEEARIWTNKYGHVVREDQASDLVKSLKEPGVVSLWGAAGAGKSPLVRRIYYDQMLIVRQDDNLIYKKYHNVFDDLKFTKFSWVDVSYPFNLIEFCWRLLLDFHSDDLKVKETATVGMLEGKDEPIQGCHKFMREDRCFVVINDLRSTDDWNLIRGAFLTLGPSRSCIVVITNEESIATYCANDKGRVFNVKGVEAEAELRPLIKGCGYYENEYEEASRFFSNRREEAAGYAGTFELVGCQNEAAAGLANYTDNVGLSSVWGISGVGKSAIVRSVYCHRMLGLVQDFNFGDTTVSYSNDMFTSFSWVDVPNPFNLTELCWHLLLDFHSDDLVAKETTAISMVDGSHDPIQECIKFLHTKCFIVMDGLRSTHDWDMISDALLSEPTNGCIIVIANEASVATYCVKPEKRVINAKGLGSDTALHLFQKVALDGTQLSDEDIEVSKLTMIKCGGLPKVIAAIGEFYRTLRSTKGFLEYINEDFMGRLQTDSHFLNLRGLFSWMKFYFDACPDSIKPCIFYLVVFPVDHKRIRRRRLVRRWIAEGYAREKFGISAEEAGENLFSELVNLSIIQELPRNLPNDPNLEYRRMFLQRPSIKVGVCQANGFFHGYIMSRPMEDNLVFSLEGHCNPSLKHAGQHLTIRSNWDRDENVFKSMDLSRLRSLTVFGEWRPFFISKDINMRLLRVLDLEDTLGVTDGDLDKIWKLLPRLKFLSLRGCKDITRLSDSFGYLMQLQTMDVRHTSIVELPRRIIKLLKLQYIRAGTTPSTSTATQDDNATCACVTPADADGASTSQPTGAASILPGNDDCGSTSQVPVVASTPPANVDNLSTGQSPPAMQPVDGDGSSTSQPPAAASLADIVGVGTSQPPATTSTAATTPPVDHDGYNTRQPPLEATYDDEAHASTPCSRARGLVFSWLSKLHRHGLVSSAHNGARFPQAAAGGIGKLTNLHTLGVVNVSGASGKIILKELKKLTQMRKLGVSGINWKNWHDLCSVISGHAHLESLSVQLEEDPTSDDLVFACFSDISQPPITLKSLKVYGEKAHIPLVWINQLHNLTKVDLEVTTSTQEDIDGLVDLPNRDIFRRVCIKPIQDGELKFGSSDAYHFRLKAIKIDCSYKSRITFQEKITHSVKLLVVHCSSNDSSLELSGLENLCHVEKIWLKGSYSNAVKQYFEQEVRKHRNKPDLKLEMQPRSS